MITNLESGATFVPSGRRILFTDRHDPDHKAPDLYTMQRDGSHRRQLTVAAASDTQPDPSPDGQHIVFTRTINGTWYVYRMPMTGETDQHRAIRLAAGWAPQYTPDGRHIVCVRQTEDSNADIWIMRKDGSHRRQLTSSQPERDADPTVSPDGRHIVWSREGDLFVMRLDGSHKSHLTDPDWYDRDPVFSPNGTYVMFSREQDDNSEDVDILRKPFPKGAAVNLTDPTADSQLEWVQDWWGPALAP
jgi:Tol biopolymer transport system component